MLQSQINSSLRVLSLFSGCGGMDLGFEGGFFVHNKSIHNDFLDKKTTTDTNKEFVKLVKTRFETIFANDIIPQNKIVWEENFQKNSNFKSSYHVESIVHLVKLHHLGMSVFPTDVDVVTGGFPCQDFSLAGKRKGFDSFKDHSGDFIHRMSPSIERRGKLYMWMKEVIDITKPKIFIAENVKGLVNLSNVKEIIQHDFSSDSNDGYLVFNPKVLQAADYGVPQSRERVFFIGIRKSALRPHILKILKNDINNADFSPYPLATHAYSNPLSSLKPPVCVFDVLRNLVEPKDSKDISHQYYSKAKFMGKHCQGQIEVNLKGVSPTIRSEHHGNIEFRRLSLENGGQYATELTSLQYIERRLTPRECALIQTFPPEYTFVMSGQGKKFEVSPSAAYKMIGNAVPPLLGFHLAKRLEQMWSEYFI
ncbi:MAG: DNA (cytosine-5-)-methyltransferase [Saprospiraceae bacterium]